MDFYFGHDRFLLYSHTLGELWAIIPKTRQRKLLTWGYWISTLTSIDMTESTDFLGILILVNVLCNFDSNIFKLEAFTAQGVDWWVHQKFNSPEFNRQSPISPPYKFSGHSFSFSRVAKSTRMFLVWPCDPGYKCGIKTVFSWKKGL